MKRRYTFLAAPMVMGLAFVIALPAMASAAMSELNFTVVRNGDDIGWQKIAIENNGEDTVVTLKSGISVEVFFIEAYKFNQDSTEVYKNGQLVKVTSKTNDDGPDYVLDVQAKGDKLVVKSAKTRNSVAKGENNTSHPAGLLPGSLWNKDTVTQTQLLNTIDGSITQLSKVENAGSETISVKGQDVTATHYILNGTSNQDGKAAPWARQAWFDSEGNLAQYELTGGDGSSILYVLR